MKTMESGLWQGANRGNSYCEDAIGEKASC